MLDKKQLLKLGFEEVDELSKTFFKKLSRERSIWATCLGTEDEEWSISYLTWRMGETVGLCDFKNDGYLTFEKLCLLFTFFGENSKNKQDRYESSMKVMGEYADKFLRNLKEEL